MKDNLGYNNLNDQFINSSCNMKLVITDVLHKLGVPSNLKGYEYIREGIELIISRGGEVLPITKELYPSIAKRYKTTWTRVERNIRSAIECAYNRGDLNLIETYFGMSVDFNKSRPTNYQFLATIADRLMIEYSYV